LDLPPACAEVLCGCVCICVCVCVCVLGTRREESVRPVSPGPAPCPCPSWALPPSLPPPSLFPHVLSARVLASIWSRRWCGLRVAPTCIFSIGVRVRMCVCEDALAHGYGCVHVVLCLCVSARVPGCIGIGCLWTSQHAGACVAARFRLRCGRPAPRAVPPCSLALYDVVIYADDSGSMQGSRWAQGPVLTRQH